ncbi:hypothetical protein [Dictyobacter formicarum]|uniref:Uncharacterized protein n=1 Tax=Dictyobacter formicarum TaxID=2778368 RepID=A0ABQ3VSK4_9CHLR|nr:hypothetical protein [Dictyobacter formicarum]GHO88614.1 hypothetical protein KSZ_66200 [Dictyobacter formicarum]
MFEKGQNGLRYFERYQEGHYHEIWNELVQLGPAVFEDRLYPEAFAVARAMIQRVRANIETLLERLVQLGFVFGYDVRLQGQLRSSFTSAHERETYREWRAWAYEQPLVFLPAKQQEEERTERQQWRKQVPSHPFFFGEEEDEMDCFFLE